MSEKINYYKSIFISDIHLGTKYAKVKELLNFLKNNEYDNLFIVGDFIDGWALKRKWYWDNDHNLLIQKLLRKSRKNTKIVYLSGNHDDFLRNLGESLLFGNIEICDELIYTAGNGKKYLVIHGDKFDGILNSMPWISHIGSVLYDVILYVDRKVNKLRSLFKKEPWSLAKSIKTKTKESLKFITKYEDILVHEAKHQKVDGVISGHIHHASSKIIDNIEYFNCGSWVENCNAVVELHDGTLKLLDVNNTLPA